MSKRKTLVSVVILVFISGIFSTSTVRSSRSSPPSGSAGEPNNNQTCASSGCHPGPSRPASLDNLLVLVGTGGAATDTFNLDNPSFNYTPNTEYNFSFTLNSTTGRYGFQIIGLTSSNQRAGTFTVIDNTNTQISTLGSRQYLGHRNANTFKNWQFKWTAPATDVGPITFYYAYNTSNADNFTSGDIIYNGKTTINADVTTQVNNLSSSYWSNLKIYPNPVKEMMYLTFQGDNAFNEELTISVYSNEGKLLQQPAKEKIQSGVNNLQWDISSLPSGIYLVGLQTEKQSEFRKFLKL